MSLKEDSWSIQSERHYNKSIRSSKSSNKTIQNNIKNENNLVRSASNITESSHDFWRYTWITSSNVS